MKNDRKFQVFVVLLMLIMIGACCTSVAVLKSQNFTIQQSGRTFDGQILFAPFYGKTTYLINGTGAVNHTWTSVYRPDAEAYWLGNGTILRPIISGGGGFEEILWDGTVVWTYKYTVSGCTCHHDVKILPNGNVLMIVWETKTRAEAIAAGLNPNNIQGNTFQPDRIIEVKQTGPNSGEVVWEWHVWDHLIQDYDDSKENYGIVGDHPELIDVNFGEDFVGDWLHTNSLDYQPTWDQILISVHNFDEVWVIDHSTTTEEATGHTGGHYGHGGDLLYRWGNPLSYDAGTEDDQKLFFQHDASWVKPGYPGEGNVLLFDNGNNRPSGTYSTVDEFTPPVDKDGWYYLEPGSAYGPEDYTWSYVADPPTSFFSNVFGGALRLRDGDTLICDGIPGRFFEVTPDNEVVWEYVNPYPSHDWNSVFKLDYLAPALPPEPPEEPAVPDLDCLGNLSWTNIKPGGTVFGSFQVQNIGDNDSLLNWTVNGSSLTWGTWTFTPASGRDLTPVQGPVTVQVYMVVPNEKNTEFNGTLRVQNQDNASDFDTIPVTLKTSASFSLPIDTPFANMIRHWLELLSDFLGRMSRGLFLWFNGIQSFR